jgi:hypothetical protein
MKCNECKYYNNSGPGWVIIRAHLGSKAETPADACILLRETCYTKYVDHRGETCSIQNESYKKIVKIGRKLSSKWSRKAVIEDIQKNCILNKNEDCKFFEEKSHMHAIVANIQMQVPGIEEEKDYDEIIKDAIEELGAQEVIEKVLLHVRNEDVEVEF